MLPRVNSAGATIDGDNLDDAMLNNESNNPMDVFCYMMVEEFLMRKGLDSTLNAYRKEWRRPDDETSVFSWYDVCMKLRLPDILESAPEKSTVLATSERSS